MLLERSVAIGLYPCTPNAATGRVLVNDPNVWLAHDFALIARDRLVGGEVPEEFLTVLPDLAVEIRSSTDRASALLQKVGQRLDAGVTVVWVIDPMRRSARRYARDGTIDLIGEHDAIDDAFVFHGPRIRFINLFASF